MTALNMEVLAAKDPASRRGACPGLSAPMPTGDGFLVRLRPIGTMALNAFAKLCAAARTHGNGVIEITGRGSIQVRGLSSVSAPQFASTVAALGIWAADGTPVLTNALAGLAADEILDAGALAADLRRALAQTALAARLAPKVSVAIDGGGALNLDGLAADVRLTAQLKDGSVVLRVGVGGDAASAAELGLIAPSRGVTAVLRMLEILAQRGRNMRAREIVASEGITPFRAALGALPALPNEKRAKSEAVGLHRQRAGLLACGVGLAFGHADAAALEQLADAAEKAGAIGLRAAPGRTLLAIGLTPTTATQFAADAERLGFIVRADDPRRYVVACAGAPICASAHIAARAMAPRIAATAEGFLGESFTIHVSGCAKGCAHAAPAALTVVGTPDGCALIADGSARQAPFAVVSSDQLPAAIAAYARGSKREAAHG